MRQLISFACLILTIICAACSGSTNASGDALPVGDASRGAALFTQSINGAPACNSCHTLDGSTLVGPSFKGYAALAPTYVEGMSAVDYTHNSITKPASYVVSGFANLMYGQYAQKLTSQQIADLIAYLLTL
ncbi:MAG: c-type cytochrome [Anaerolineaceae bacterium]|nr:c-type cytochrome [Anaerolineaceae bacterium]